MENKSLHFTISEEAYQEYLKNRETFHNERIRPDNQNILDWLSSSNMAADPEGRKVLEAIGNL